MEAVEHPKPAMAGYGALVIGYGSSRRGPGLHRCLVLLNLLAHLPVDAIKSAHHILMDAEGSEVQDFLPLRERKEEDYKIETNRNGCTRQDPREAMSQR